MEAFGRYQLEHRVGIGGMGEVYAGKVVGAEGFERPVAIKVILPDLCDDEKFRNMFVDEAKISMHLHHANIVQVLDLGEVDGRWYIAMEFVEGPNLSRVIKLAQKRGRLLPVPLAVYVTMEVLKALDYAHNARDKSGAPLSIVHRDVTPQNVLLSLAGEVKLSDFGIARAAGRVQRTATGIVRGKLYYMAPEQFEGGAATGPWTDVYATAMVLQMMLTGKNPLDGLDEAQVLERLKSPAPLLSEDTGKLVPPALGAVLQTALAPNYRRRYQTAAQFLEALESFVLENKIKTGARYLADFLRDMATQEAVARGLPLPPELSMPPRGADPTTKQTPSIPRDSKSLALVMGRLEEPGPPPLLPVPDAVAIGLPPTRDAGAFAAVGVAALLLVAAAFVVGQKVAPGDPLPPVAAHAPALDRAADVGFLFFDPYPWADCKVDGVALGASPIVAHPLQPGRHTLEYRGVDGRLGTRGFDIRAGRATVVAP